MTPKEFCYWLSGYMELAEGCDLTAGKVKIIKQHLDLVMKNESSKPGIAEALKVYDRDLVKGSQLIC